MLNKIKKTAIGVVVHGLMCVELGCMKILQKMNNIL